MNRSATCLLVFVFVAGACSTSDESSVDEATTSSTVSEPTTASTETDGDNEASEEVTLTGPAVFDPSIALFESEFEPIEVGNHRFSNIGTEFTIRVDESVMVQPNEPGRVVFSSFASEGPGDEDVIVLRATHLADPATLSDEDGTWPADDIENWLDAVPSTLLVTDRARIEVGGLEAERFDVAVDAAAECDPSQCAFFAFSDLAAVWLDLQRHYRVWHILQEGELPIIIIVGAATSDDPWLDDADRLVGGMAFGPVKPHIIDPNAILWELGYPSEVPAGTVTIPVAGGMTFELNEDRFIFQTPGYAAIFPDGPAENDIFIARSTQAGPIGSPASGVARLEEHPSIDVVAVTQETVAGYQAMRVEVTGRGSPVLSWEDPFSEDAVWSPPLKGTVWFIDIGETSPLVVTSETFEGDDLLELTNTTAELLLATLILG